MNTTTKYILLGLRLLAAIIMLQTLYFKFTAAPESVYIFTTLGLEPFGRIGIGVGELIASVLLFTNLRWMGAALAIGLMSGAIFFHLTQLGIEVMNDGGQLFIYALLVLISSSIVLFFYRKNMVVFLGNILSKK